jgi:hypothetical protein
MEHEKNLLGTPLETCSLSPLTGFNRSGSRQSSERDHGVHGVCNKVTEEFLNFTRESGNDLSSPNELYGFPGLKQGDIWCLRASRWQDALDHDAAPPIVLLVTVEAVLRYIGLDNLLKFAVDVRH